MPLAPSAVPLVIAALAFDIALVPTLLPRPWWVNGIFAGVAAAEAYLVAALVRGVARSAVGRAIGRPARGTAGRTVGRGMDRAAGRAPARGGRSRRLLWRSTVRGRALQATLALLLLVSATAGQLRQAALERAMGLDPGSAVDQVLHQGGSVALGLVTATVLVGLLALLAYGVALVCRVVRRPFAGSRAMRGALMVPVLVLAACVVPNAAGSPAAAVPRARSTLVSDVAGPAAGASLGPKGRQFLRGVTPTSTIERVTGRPALSPVRAYAELRPGEDDDARAARGVEQLRRAGGLDRSVIVVVVPTGSGWVDPAAVCAVETLTGGDVATLAVQYADVPSWIAYLRGGHAAERSAAAAIRDARALLDTVPVDRRPRLLVYGESLGALGGLQALAADGGTVDGALWVGVPADVASLGRRARRTGQTVLVHRDDPVAAWSAALAVRPASGWRSAWWPVVTFWQATADLVAAYSTPDGYGHRYGTELVDAWQPVLRAAGVEPQVGGFRPGGGESELDGVRRQVARVSDGGSSLPSREPGG